MGYSPGEKSGPGGVASFQGSLPLISSILYPQIGKISKGGRKHAWIKKELLIKLGCEKEAHKREIKNCVGMNIETAHTGIWLGKPKPIWR